MSSVCRDEATQPPAKAQPAAERCGYWPDLESIAMSLRRLRPPRWFLKATGLTKGKIPLTVLRLTRTGRGAFEDCRRRVGKLLAGATLTRPGRPAGA